MPVLLFFLLSTCLLTEVTAVDECDSGPCMNGAACSDQYADSYTCECVEAWQGVNCEVPIVYQVCPFGHVYEYVANITTGVLPRRFSCQANFRFQGATEVNFTFVSHDIEPNKDAIWLEAGFFADSSNDSGALDSGDLVKQPTLTFKDAGSNYWIVIFTDMTGISRGLTLEISADRDDCYPISCMNGATCIDLLRDYRCICAPGYDGINCQDGVSRHRM
ncbi:fibropellin-3-like [Strongylocentrotus purpuratus]|uniref:EGF-like domain-containing protein n=1 Tax=Strongylocentrotus purpuratus TaxID=7668 RepID=A0A7M7NUJ6_STRPU|nr:fibropellin-3-like [Strongylocentrotus purpuratus]